MEVIQSCEIPKLIPDGSSILLTGFNLAGFAEEAFIEIEKSFLAQGHPRDLTLYWQASVGNMGSRGLGHMCHEGLLKRGIGGHLSGCGPAMMQFSRDGKAEIYNWPQGVCFDMMRAVAAKQPGVITKIGLRTFMDPRYGGGRMNAVSNENLTELITLDGEEWLRYKAPQKLHVAIIRGTVSDEFGNITLEKEGLRVGQLMAAQAARATGGVVICQVERLVKGGSLNPKKVEVPGILVDYVYVARPEYHWQTAASTFSPAFAGMDKVPLQSVPHTPLNERKVIARRAAMELRAGSIVNLGIGTPEIVASVTAEEGCEDCITLTTEAGSIGGIPAKGNDFGCAWNADAVIDSSSIFTMYDGGILDLGCLGFLEIGPNGDLNASSRGGLGVGVGGFMDIAGGASKVVFLGTFTGGRQKSETPVYRVANGRLIIEKEGNAKKFVRRVGQISFSGEVALNSGKQVLYITERAVFRLSRAGLELIEIAPGIDLERDILAWMEFQPIISPALKQMDSAIFRAEWGGLQAILLPNGKVYTEKHRKNCVKGV